MNQNVDANEIEKFSGFGKDWWDSKGSQAALHDFNLIRVPWICEGLMKTKIVGKSEREAPNNLEGVAILDVGCGGGILTEALGRFGATVVGLDAASKLIELARDHLENQKDVKGKITYVCETIEEHCEKNPEKYDVVVASEVIEHIGDKESFLEACVKALKPGGSIFMTAPNRGFVSWFFNIFLGEYWFESITKGTHDYKLFISPEEIFKILEKFGCKAVTAKGLRYVLDKAGNYWQYQKYSGIHFCLHALKPE